MTCVVALKDGDTVYFGADSALTDAGNIITFPSKPGKLFARPGLLIGCAGDSGVSTAIFEMTKDPNEEALKTFNSIEELLTARLMNWLAQASGGDKSQFLLSKGQKVCFVTSRFYQIYDDYYAIGGAYSVALGSLASTIGISPADRVRIALEVSQKHCSMVKEPFIYHQINGGLNQ